MNDHPSFDGFTHTDFFRDEQAASLTFDYVMNKTDLVRQNVRACASELTLRVAKPQFCSSDS
jgi:hypothetical protein